MYKRILVPVDGSKTSTAGLREAMTALILVAQAAPASSSPCSPSLPSNLDEESACVCVR